MLLGKSLLINILISGVLSITTTGYREDEEPGAAGKAATTDPATSPTDKIWKTETTPTEKTKENPRFRGYAKFVNNIATTNQGYDYKPTSVSSKKPSSTRPLTPTDKPANSDDDSTPEHLVRQKLRLIIRPDYKRLVATNNSETINAASSDKSYSSLPAVRICSETELKASQDETVVDSLDLAKLEVENNREGRASNGTSRGNLVEVAVRCSASMYSGEPVNDDTQKNPAHLIQESLQSASANDGNEKLKSSADDNEEDKKTLSQQVADGKYGLIHTELFSVKPTRPGILNYEINPEVPKDNVNNLGGLSAEEIWLAENHLLVLSGGGFSDKNSRTKWTPIDNYQAPRRQVKIPERPKIPPPFPVQLTDDGPIEFIKDENGTENRPPFFPPDFNPSNFPPPFPPSRDFNPLGNTTTGNGFPPFPPPYPPPFPILPGVQNDSRPFFPRPLPKGGFPPLPGPGAIGNQTDNFDEDDPSLYYPPPYDFYYPKDNHSIVPPGPLIPGIVLPPPPDFFAPLEEKPKSKPKTKPTRIRPKPVYLPPSSRKPQIFRTPTTTTSEAPSTVNHIEYSDKKIPDYYYTQTTSPKTIADEITNEITQTTIANAKYSLPIDNKGWMPIPAPIPSYITGPKKAVKAGVIYTIPQTTPPIKTQFQGYTYDKPKVLLKPNLDFYYAAQDPKYNNHHEFDPQNFTQQINNELNLIYPIDNTPLKGSNFISTTSSPLPLYDSVPFKHNFKDYFGGSNQKGVKGFLQSTTDVPYKTYSTTLRPYGRPKALEATYYFYEEPRQIAEDYVDGNRNNQVAHTTARPQGSFKPGAIKPAINHHRLTGFKTIEQTTTPAPEKYYYVADLNEPERFNYDDKYKPGIFEDVKKPPKPETGPRPIYEFSYIAPAYYGSSHPSQLNHQIQNIRPFYEKPRYITTPKPTKLVYINPVRAPSSPLDDYYSTPKPPKVIKNTTKSTTQQTPWYGLSPQQVATENPYYAFFTHHDESLIDDITKTYFTIFGQKIKPTPPTEIEPPKKLSRPTPPKIGPTPPLLLNGAVYSSPKPNYIEIPSYHSTTQSIRPEQTTADYEASSEDYGQDYGNHFTTRTPQIAFPFHDQNEKIVEFTTPKPYYQEAYNANDKLLPVKYSTPQPTVESSNQHNQYNHQKHLKVRPGSLYNDELVNYKRPLPPINPDAEILDVHHYRAPKYKTRPRIPSGTNQFISYRLPGNGGGHFYFLTPQAVRHYDSIDPVNAESGNNDENNYYKRDVKQTSTNLATEKPAAKDVLNDKTLK